MNESSRLELVVWHDSWFDFELERIEDRRAAYLVRTVGFVVADGASTLSLAAELLPDGDGFRAVTHIRKSAIESRTTLWAEKEVP